MTTNFQSELRLNGISRRDFMRLISVSAAGAAMTPWLSGCAKNPVTGESQLMFVSKDQEIALDKENSPHQFSSDNGPVQDAELNDYISQVGMKLSALSHRPEMPYSFRVVNANYVNAYAFPGGSIAATRGIMLELDNEAELSALLGHEIGHVNARHYASRASTGLLLSAVVLAGTVYVASETNGGWAQVTNILGGVAAGALLAHYSRSDERQADALGMEYSAKAEENPEGMVGLHELLVSKSNSDPSLLELMFATHPMSSERLATAQEATQGKYAAYLGLPKNKERFMDNTARLRAMGEAIKAQQKGEKLLARGNPDDARDAVAQSLAMAPNDYSGLLLMSQCENELGNHREGARWAEEASEIYPQEPKAVQMLGASHLLADNYDAAYQEFTLYDAMLPGNPQTTFLRGLSMEGMGQRQKAARLYSSYINEVGQGDQANYAASRLSSWGY
ncbi:MAG: M48 family metalloprotease [Desulfovibrionaceae bacterium]